MGKLNLLRSFTGTALLAVALSASASAQCDAADVYLDEPFSRTAQTEAVDYSQEVLRLTNLERTKHGLSPLMEHGLLGAAATAHSEEMLKLDYFSHTSPTPGKTTPEDRVRSTGANPRLVAENIFSCSGYEPNGVAQLAVEQWLQSPGHRRNMLDPRATHIGIGFVEIDGSFAVTQVFGNGL